MTSAGELVPDWSLVHYRLVFDADAGLADSGCLGFG